MRSRRPRRRSPRQASAGPEAWGPSARGVRQVAHVCDAFGAQNDAEATPMRHGFGPKRRSLRHAGEKTCCRKGLGVARRARKWRMVCTCRADGSSRRCPEVFEKSENGAPRLATHLSPRCSPMPENGREVPASAPVSAASSTVLRRYRRAHRTPLLPGCSRCREHKITAEAQSTRSTRSDVALELIFASCAPPAPCIFSYAMLQSLVPNADPASRRATP